VREGAKACRVASTIAAAAHQLSIVSLPGWSTEPVSSTAIHSSEKLTAILQHKVDLGPVLKKLKLPCRDRHAWEAGCRLPNVLLDPLNGELLFLRIVGEVT
jgi:hypothetical protein